MVFRLLDRDSTESMRCRLIRYGFPSCGNLVRTVNGSRKAPCELAVKYEESKWWRLIYDYMLSRPEDYLSIYQSCCNHDCMMCHSWYFSQYATGLWYSSDDIVEICSIYYEMITLKEPRDKATMWHATDHCKHCGMCVEYGMRGEYCPNVLKPSQIILSPQGYGPARNIVSFTGGDTYCCYEFYVECFKSIKREFGDELWIHIETNGYGLIPEILEELVQAGLDSIWLDMKAYSKETYRKLCGTDNEHILELPARILDEGLTLEIVLLYIPRIVGLNEIDKFGELLASVDKNIPIMLLAFFPEYKLKHVKPPSLSEMVKAYEVLRMHGLKRVKLGNVHVFCNDEELKGLINKYGLEVF